MQLAPFLRSLWQRRVAVTAVAALVFLAAILVATYYALNLPQLVLDRQQTLVYGPNRFSPASPGALRVLVRDSGTGQPVAGADVTVRLQPKSGGAAHTLYTGKTDARGTAPVAFEIPDTAVRDQTLVVETGSGVGHDRIEKAIVVQRQFKILVTTDKPLYQPGQTIHLRALALGALDRVPAKDQPLEFLIEDPKGNKIYRKTVPTSTYGITSADFALADTLNSGTYKITASIGDTKSEKSVTVKPYVLPKFKLSVETERGYYLPGERVAGRVRADYFFGKPVAKSAVTIKGVVYDVARAETVSLNGQTDADGVYSFSFTLPNFFAARGLNKSQADFGLEVSLTDQANQTETTSLVLPIAADPIIIDAVPESGKLVPGVENIVYILTSLPDGSPVETTVTVDSGRAVVHTGKYGLAEVRWMPSSTSTLAIQAVDASGRRAARTVTLPIEPPAPQVLLRPDRATYRVGETMHLDLFTSGGVGTVYLDLVKEGQTMSTRSVDTANGQATAEIDATAEMVGAVQLHAYHVGRDGTVQRDTRVVFVEPENGLNIAIQADRDTYRPGDDSHITFQVTDAQGAGVASALGVTAVDESVFALAEQDPGFAKLYFLLTKELLDPKFQVKGFDTREVVAPDLAQPEELRDAQDRSAQAAWAGAAPFDFALRVNSQPDKRTAANQAQTVAFNTLSAWLALVLSLVPPAMAGLVMAWLKAGQILKRALSLWSIGILAYVGASPFVIPVVAAVGFVLVRYRMGAVFVAALAGAWLIGFGILAAYAILRRDRQVQLTLILLVAYLVTLGAFWSNVERATSFGQGLVFAVFVTFLAGIGALVLLGIGLYVRRERAPGAAAILISLLMIPTTIWLALLPSAGPFLRAMGNPGLYIPAAYLTGCTRAAPSSGGNALRDLGSSGVWGLDGGFTMGASAPLPPAGIPAPTMAPAAAKAGEAAQATAAPRLREYFPETLYVNPQVITDENGRAALDIPLADSITTWRLAAMASSQRGDLGSASAGLRVFQDFFVDLDLPVALTQNDEISVPVAVYNYLPAAQKVRLQLDKQPWFEIQEMAAAPGGAAEKTLTIASNDVDVVYFRIKAIQFGMHKLKVTALGDKMSDAIQREIRVYPDGKQLEVTQSNWLKADTAQTVEIPAAAISGASRIEVKIYPGIVSQAINGLDGLLKVPYG